MPPFLDRQYVLKSLVLLLLLGSCESEGNEKLSNEVGTRVELFPDYYLVYYITLGDISVYLCLNLYWGK